MKIYLFNPETGVYLGEDFADDNAVKSGIYRIPDDATVIPPPRTEPGEMAVFHRESRKWEVRQNPRKGMGSDCWHQTFTECSRKTNLIFSSRDSSGSRGDK